MGLLKNQRQAVNIFILTGLHALTLIIKDPKHFNQMVALL